MDVDLGQSGDRRSQGDGGDDFIDGSLSGIERTFFRIRSERAKVNGGM